MRSAVVTVRRPAEADNGVVPWAGAGWLPWAGAGWLLGLGISRWYDDENLMDRWRQVRNVAMSGRGRRITNLGVLESKDPVRERRNTEGKSRGKNLVGVRNLTGRGEGRAGAKGEWRGKPCRHGGRKPARPG